MFSVFLAATGRSRATQRVAGSQRTAQVSERGKNLLVSGMIREHGRLTSRICGRLAVIVPGEGDEGLAGDLQVADLLVKLAEPGGELIDQGLGLPGLAGQCLFPHVDLVQQEPARVARGHADRHDGMEVQVNRRAITSVIAQYTRDAELDSRCS
jgi:hypothetical protein